MPGKTPGLAGLTVAAMTTAQVLKIVTSTMICRSSSLNGADLKRVVI